MVSFDTNVLVYATTSISDVKVMRARDSSPAQCGLRRASCCCKHLANSAMWRSAKREYQLRTSEGQLTLGAPCCQYKRPMTAIFWPHFEAVRAHRLAFWDAMLWASARRAGVRHLLSEDLQDGFALQGVTFINPFNQENDQ
jgi:hypothetical protein